MEKKRVLFYNGQLFMGGIERVLISYLQGLAKEKDLEITVLIKIYFLKIYLKIYQLYL